MLDRKTQPPRAARPQHQPVAPLRKRLVAQSLAEVLVVDPEILDLQPTLRYARAPPRLEHVQRPPLQPLWQPPPHRPPAQPIVLKVRQLLEVLKLRDLPPHVQVPLLLLPQPE